MFISIERTTGVRRIVRRGLLTAAVLAVTGVVAVFAVNAYVEAQAAPYIMKAEQAPAADAVLVLGAAVYDGDRLSSMLKDRLDTAMEVEKAGATLRFIVSGDHGRVQYDEVNAMKAYLMKQGIANEAVFMDHAGFSTYESMYRARDIFQVKKLIIVTQGYHLPRAIYSARMLGIEAYGVAADKQSYAGMRRYQLRELAARCKDFALAAVLKPQPTYLGDTIPVSGDGRATNDKPIP